MTHLLLVKATLISPPYHSLDTSYLGAYLPQDNHHILLQDEICSETTDTHSNQVYRGNTSTDDDLSPEKDVGVGFSWLV